jgi:mitogen-activated protein kinase 1/3
MIFTMDTDMLLPDDRLANFATGPDYQLMDVIGEGAYGIVVYFYHLKWGKTRH